MDKFIANSQASKKILNIAQMASGLPVNVLIVGNTGVGKKLLATYVLPDVTIFDGLILEQSIINKTINLDGYKEIIISDVEKILNKKEFMKSLGDIKIVATSKFNPTEIESSFAIKIDIPDLSKRPEDLEELINIYTKQASMIYKYKLGKMDIDIDLTQNGVTLKESIYKSVLLKSLNKEDILKSLKKIKTIKIY